MLTFESQKMLFFAILYSFFIIYGSLVPLDFQYRSLADALQAFSNIRYLDLKANSRADWIANIVLYIPLTFLLAARFLQNHSSQFRTFFTALFILFSSITLAITIEFCQLFFPPRTVSQNDLIAEVLGSFLGLLIWFLLRQKLIKLMTHILEGGEKALLAIVIVYFLGYLAISFFPYDFVISWQEFQTKLKSGNDSFFISSIPQGLSFYFVSFISEALLVIPIGILTSYLLKWHPARFTAVILIGFLLGIIIETIQLFLINGTAQGASIFIRAIGFGIGERIFKNFSHYKNRFNNLQFKKIVIFSTIPYFLMLTFLSGWSLSKLDFSNNVIKKFDEINWLPFYYHYYTTETIAFISLISNFCIYCPIGLFYWLWMKGGHNHQVSWKNSFFIGLVASIISFAIESGKLFLIAEHPDPTNIIISFMAASLTYMGTQILFKWIQN